MAWISSILSALAIIWYGQYVRCLSCDVVELFKRVNGPTLYSQQQSPIAVAGRLGLCSWWCAAIESCLAFSWCPGQCIQVGPSGSGDVAMIAFMVKKNTTFRGKEMAIIFILPELIQYTFSFIPYTLPGKVWNILKAHGNNCYFNSTLTCREWTKNAICNVRN